MKVYDYSRNLAVMVQAVFLDVFYVSHTDPSVHGYSIRGIGSFPSNAVLLPANRLVKKSTLKITLFSRSYPRVDGNLSEK
mgnify:CR=1 FL=1|jgi:hypothetical protein